VGTDITGLVLPYDQTMSSSVSVGDVGGGAVLCAASTKVTARGLGLTLSLRSIDLT